MLKHSKHLTISHIDKYVVILCWFPTDLSVYIYITFCHIYNKGYKKLYIFHVFPFVYFVRILGNLN
jgi:hypothetical protein